MTDTLKHEQEMRLEIDTLAGEYLRVHESGEAAKPTTFLLAERSVANVLELSSRSSSVHELVLSLLEDGRSEEAFAVVKGLIMANPQNSRFHTLLASLQLSEGRMNEAMAAYSHALALDPGDVDALVQRGEVYLARGLYELARQDFRAALELGGDEASSATTRVTKLLEMTERRRRAAGREGAIDVPIRSRCG